MNEIDLIKLLGQGSITVAALIILGRVVWQIGQRMIAAIDRVTARIDEHTKNNTAALSEVRTDLAVIKGHLDIAINWSGQTPVHGAPIHASPTPVARETTGRVLQGEYHVRQGSGRSRNG